MWFLVSGLFYGDLKHLLAETYDIFFNYFIVLNDSSFDERGELIRSDIIFKDEITCGFAGTLEHQHTFPKGGVDLINDKDYPVGYGYGIEQRG